MEKLIKENLIFILLPILVIVAGGYFAYTYTMEALDTNNAVIDKQQEVETKKQKVQQLMREKQTVKEQPKEKKVPKSGKVIYEVLDQQFSPEASFGIMFENVISNVTSSGVKIRSIEYNYHPQDDKVLAANAPGYNACELSFVTVGSYSQLQAFFKNITKENYLTNIYEVYIEPYDKNKAILIAKFKIRLYTKIVLQ